jgi:hypothetical protein
VSADNESVSTGARPPITPRGVARRRLATAGLGAASVLWSINSRAQMSPMKCISPSAGVSGSLSSHDHKDLNCIGGNSPGYWKNHEGWPCSRGKMFSSVFTSTGLHEGYRTASMLQLLQGCDFDRQNNSIGKHLVATYLNLLQGLVPFLSLRTLEEMWQQLCSHRTYTLSPTVSWSVEQTKNYLEGTYHTKDPVEESKPEKPEKPDKPEKPPK